MKIAVMVSGGGTNLQSILDHIESKSLRGVVVSLVISSSSTAYAVQRANKYGIPVRIVSRREFADVCEYDREMLILLNEFSVDLVVLAGFLSLLGPEVIAKYSNRIINIHPSLIPAFCGPGMYGIRPHMAAIERGVKVSGATVHFVNECYDDGPIILQKSVPVLGDDTAENLQQRIMIECEQIILPQAIQLIADKKVIIENNIARVLA
jgi:phosphoribosylglycinamide formyltransferase-1